MATNPRTALISLDEYLAAEEAAEGRSEFIDGEVRAMVGGTLEHGLIVQNIARHLGNRLQGGPCRVVSQGTHVRVQQMDRIFYPDVAVFCGEPKREKRLRDLLLDPAVIVEVLSPSSEDYDRGRKWENYRRIPSLQDYLLVSQDQPLVERYTRHGEGFWLFGDAEGLDAVVRLDSIGVELSLREIYEGVLDEQA